MPRYLKLGGASKKRGEADAGSSSSSSSLRRVQSSREGPVIAPPPHHPFTRLGGGGGDGDANESPPLRRAASSREQHQQKQHQQHQQKQHQQHQQKQQQQQANGVVHDMARRAQSMRYNRIVSSPPVEEEEEEEEMRLDPPRHSSFDALPSATKQLVLVSASYRTGDGQILSLECTQCGRWLGTLPSNQHTTQLRLCQICHPLEQETKVGGARGGGIVRSLRKLLGLKRRK